MAVRGWRGAWGSSGLVGAAGGLCHRILLETQASDASLTEQFSLSGERVVNWDAVNLDRGRDAQCVLCSPRRAGLSSGGQA